MRISAADLCWLLSPSRKIIDLWKRGDRVHRGRVLRTWNGTLFWVEAIACGVLCLVASQASSRTLNAITLLSLVYAGSRINEIVYAFYNDALSRNKESDLTVTDRMRMAMFSYYGLAFNFAVLYYILPIDGLFDAHPGSFAEAFYFSGVTLSTVGYGDIVPRHSVSRFLALYEVFAGILILAVAVGTYIGGMKDGNDTPTSTA